MVPQEIGSILARVWRLPGHIVEYDSELLSRRPDLILQALHDAFVGRGRGVPLALSVVLHHVLLIHHAGEEGNFGAESLRVEAIYENLQLRFGHLVRPEVVPCALLREAQPVGLDLDRCCAESLNLRGPQAFNEAPHFSRCRVETTKYKVAGDAMPEGLTFGRILLLPGVI